MKASIWIFLSLVLILYKIPCHVCWMPTRKSMMRPSSIITRRSTKLLLDSINHTDNPSPSSSSASSSYYTMEGDNNNYRVAQVVDGLSETMKHHSLTPSVIQILQQWGRKQQKEEQFNLLDHKNLLHEIEESMVALEMLLNWMNDHVKENDKPIVLMDICCGKGICSFLASYLFENDKRISKIIMMDKPEKDNTNQNNKNILDWSHVHIANENASLEHRPKIQAVKENLFEMDRVIDWLASSTSSEEPQQRYAFIGIHLCKNLSPTFVGIANSLGPDQVPFLCLAPCCLPRVVVQSKYQKNNNKNGPDNNNKLLQVALYETSLQRQARLRAMKLRRNSKQRHTRATRKCILCQSTNHTVHRCERLVTYSLMEQSEILSRAAALEPCWKCGEIGHQKKDCPSTQISSTPALISKPVLQKDVSHIMHTENPFAAYCHLLSTTIERDYVRVVESKYLQKTESSLLEHRSNWNRERKTIYIVATSKEIHESN